MNRMKLKNRKKQSKNKKLIIILTIFMLLFFGFYNITNNVYKYLLNYAKAELVKLTTVVINGAVTKETLSKLNSEELYYVTKNSNNEIEMVDYNSNMINEFLDNATNEIQYQLLRLQNGNLDISDELNEDSNVLFNIPLGIVANNPIFNTLGPKIPVKMQIIGSLLTNVNVKVKEYGINNAIIEMFIFIEITVKVILPLVTDEILITNEIPISYKLINGKIPEYYGTNGINKSSNIFSIPLE